MKGDLLSVIIPTLNEAAGIVQCVKVLAALPEVEVVVADGGSSDGTAEAARRAGARVIHTEPGRGRQMNAGAQAASGAILLFLHADTTLPEGFVHSVRQALANQETSGGAFRFTLDDRSCLLRFVTWTTNFRSDFMGIVFGDQAIFTTKELFHRAGGYPEQPIMEDYEFLRRLRSLGRFVLLTEAAVTSARRWKAVGAVRNSLLNVLITWAYVLGVSPERLHQWRRKGTRGKDR